MVPSEFQTFRDNLIAQKVTLVAVSKTQSLEKILELYHQGQRIFGENKVQELLEKKTHLPEDIHWHLIGHLQTNKVRAILPHVTCIQSVDSVKLLDLIERESLRLRKNTDVLIQVKISAEATKYGFDPDTLIEELQEQDVPSLSAVRICGVMGMASNVTDVSILRQEFSLLRDLFQRMKEKLFTNQDSFRHISMGMSGDYQLAIEEGSTMVRIGSLLFGKRE